MSGACGAGERERLGGGSRGPSRLREHRRASCRPAPPGCAGPSARAAPAAPRCTAQDTPDPLPALVSSQLTSRLQAFPTLGLDGRQLMVRPVALAAAVPGAPAVGHRRGPHATRNGLAYFTDDSLVAEQVWVAPGSLAGVRAKLAAAGVKIDGEATAADAEAVLMRQGPGAGQRAVPGVRGSRGAAGRGRRRTWPLPGRPPAAATSTRPWWPGAFRAGRCVRRCSSSRRWYLASAW